MRARTALVATILAGLAGCGDNNDPGGGPRAAFELPAGDEPISLRDIPFPNDVLLDDGGELEIPPESMPFGLGADPDVLADASAAFAELDCFGATAGVIFPLAGLGEEDSAVPSSLSDDTVLLIDLERGTRLPVEHHVREREQQIYVRARRGTVLRGGDRVFPDVQFFGLQNRATTNQQPPCKLTIKDAHRLPVR